MSKMKSLLATRPRSCTAVKINTTYAEIQHALTCNTDERLQQIVKTCQQDPNNILFVIYITDEDSILIIFGQPITTLVLKSTSIQRKMNEHAVRDYIYIFCHARDS